MNESNEVVLITGGSGFLGQHIIRLLQERDDNVKEIRVLDLLPYEKKLDHVETKTIKTFIGDICKPETMEEAFNGVDCVFHLASYVNFQYPPNYKELERVNVKGTKNVINLCIKYNVPRLIYTSTSAVTLIPYLGRGTFSIIVNQTESKAKTPAVDTGFLVPGYPASKLRTEKIVLAAYGSPLSNGNGVLNTVALRPTVMYGEADELFVPKILRISKKFQGQIPRLAGPGGKHQLTYAGNVAWAHLRAKDVLQTEPKRIAGLPIFVTDDTPIETPIRFCSRLASATESIRLKPSWWTVPFFFAYFIAILLEMIFNILHPLFGMHLDFTPRGFCSYFSSMIMFSRLRANLHLDYEPIYNEQKSILNSANWYEKWYNMNISVKKKRVAKNIN